MPFEAGQSGNPNGTPGPKKIKLFKDALQLSIKRADGDKCKLGRIADALVEKAIAGDVPAIKEIADRLDGKVSQPLSGDEENPVTFAFAGLKDAVAKKLAGLVEPDSETDVRRQPE